MPAMATKELETKRLELIREVNRTGDAYDSVRWTGLGSRFLAKRAYKKAKKAISVFYTQNNVSQSPRK